VGWTYIQLRKKIKNKLASQKKMSINEAIVAHRQLSKQENCDEKLLVDASQQFGSIACIITWMGGRLRALDLSQA
jgi:hypothetical protein